MMMAMMLFTMIRSVFVVKYKQYNLTINQETPPFPRLSREAGFAKSGENKKARNPAARERRGKQR